MTQLVRALVLAASLIFGVVTPAWAGMTQPILVSASPQTAPSNTAARWLPLAVGYSAGGWASTVEPARTPVATAGAYVGLRVRVSVAPGGAGKYWDVALVKNGSDTGLTCRIEDTATTCSDTDTIAVDPATDDVALKFNPTGTPAALGFVQVGLSFTASAANRGQIFSGHQSTATGGFYMALGAASAAGTTQATAKSVVAADGVLAGLRVRVSTAPSSTHSRTYTLEKNGVATAVTCTVAGTDQICADPSNTVSVVAGDVVNFAATQSGSPAASPAQVALEWRPAVDGTSLAFLTFSTALSSSAPRYANLNGQTNNGLTSTTLEADGFNLAPMDFTLKAIRASLSAAPGVGSRLYTARVNGADSVLSVTLSGSDTAKATASDVAVSAGDVLSASHLPSGSATAASATVGFAIFTGASPSEPATFPLLMRSGGR